MQFFRSEPSLGIQDDTRQFFLKEKKNILRKPTSNQYEYGHGMLSDRKLWLIEMFHINESLFNQALHCFYSVKKKSIQCTDWCCFFGQPTTGTCRVTGVWKKSSRKRSDTIDLCEVCYLGRLLHDDKIAISCKVGTPGSYYVDGDINYLLSKKVKWLSRETLEWILYCC